MRLGFKARTHTHTQKKVQKEQQDKSEKKNDSIKHITRTRSHSCGKATWLKVKGINLHMKIAGHSQHWTGNCAHVWVCVRFLRSTCPCQEITLHSLPFPFRLESHPTHSSAHTHTTPPFDTHSWCLHACTHTGFSDSLQSTSFCSQTAPPLSFFSLQ